MHECKNLRLSTDHWYEIQSQSAGYLQATTFDVKNISMLRYVPWNVVMILLCFVYFWYNYQTLLDSCDLFTNIIQGCLTGTGAILWSPKC